MYPFVRHGPVWRYVLCVSLDVLQFLPFITSNHDTIPTAAAAVQFSLIFHFGTLPSKHESQCQRNLYKINPLLLLCMCVCVILIVFNKWRRSKIYQVVFVFCAINVLTWVYATFASLVQCTYVNGVLRLRMRPQCKTFKHVHLEREVWKIWL